jgi:hypothetical protein
MTSDMYLSVVKVFSSHRRYIKKTKAELAVLVRDYQADPKQIRLLNILGPQLKKFINEGKPDLDCLLSSLKAEDLVSEEDCKGLKSVDTVSLTRIIQFQINPTKFPDIGGVECCCHFIDRLHSPGS